MKHALILALLLVAGCKMEPADTALRTKLKAAIDRAAAHADSVANHSAIPNTSRPEHANASAAKVAAVMAANDITLPQVVAFRVVREAIFNPGERFMIVSYTEASAAALMREIEYQVKSLTNTATAGGGGGKEKGE